MLRSRWWTWWRRGRLTYRRTPTSSPAPPHKSRFKSHVQFFSHRMESSQVCTLLDGLALASPAEGKERPRRSSPARGGRTEKVMQRATGPRSAVGYAQSLRLTLKALRGNVTSEWKNRRSSVRHAVRSDCREQAQGYVQERGHSSGHSDASPCAFSLVPLSMFLQVFGVMFLCDHHISVFGRSSICCGCGLHG